MVDVSYDLQVYLRTEVGLDQLASLLSPGTEPDQPPRTRQLVVVRGARRRYSFTVGAAHRCEAEDVPPEVDQVLLGATHVHEVLVEGSAATEIDHAIRFARRVAREFDGAVLDQQTGEVWTRSTSRQVTRPVRQDRLGVVTLTWYRTAAGIDANTPAAFVDAARRLPEAMPRRFGDFERSPAPKAGALVAPEPRGSPGGRST